MSVSCIICKDILLNDVASSPCGHMFHNKCINQWLPKSSTCPQCRAKIAVGKILKLYPTFSDENIDNVNDLQSQLENALDKLKSKEDKCDSLSSQLSKAQASLEKTQKILHENSLREMKLEASLVAVTQQAKYLKEENKKVTQLQKENVELKEKLEILHGMQKVLHGTQKDVEDMTKSYSDVKTVATFASALKRALNDTEKEKSLLMNKVKSLQTELQLEKDKCASLKKSLSAQTFSVDDTIDITETSPLLQKNLHHRKPNHRTSGKSQGELEAHSKRENVCVLSSETDSDKEPNKRKILPIPTDLDSDTGPKRRKIIPILIDSDSDSDICREIRTENRHLKNVTQSVNNSNSPYLQVKQGWLGTLMNKNQKSMSMSRCKPLRKN